MQVTSLFFRALSGIIIIMKTIDEDIKTGQFKAAYLLYGDEDYLKKQYRDKLTKALMGQGDTMNFAKYEGKDSSIEEIISFADTMPFFADRRVVLVEDSGFFKSSQETLADYFPISRRRPAWSLWRVTWINVPRLTKRSQRQAVRWIFSMPDERMLTSWMMARVKAAGKTMTGCLE